jgi:DnaK suppressor protein
VLDITQLKAFDDRLCARASLLTVEVNAARRHAGTDLRSETSDLKDAASAEAQAVVADAEVERELAELGEIRAARERIRNGTYGSCVECGTEIDLDRIGAHPQASRCLKCQLRAERASAARAARRAALHR